MDTKKLIQQINKISKDKKINNIEKKVKIAQLLSGKYKGKNGEITIYRSPGDRTLLAIKGVFNGQKIHKIDVDPRKILTAIENISENTMKKSQLRKIVKEEINKLLTESKFRNIWKKVNPSKDDILLISATFDSYVGAPSPSINEKSYVYINPTQAAKILKLALQRGSFTTKAKKEVENLISRINMATSTTKAESIKEAADPIIKQIGDIAKNKKLVSMRDDLEKLFNKKDIDFSFSPVPHFQIKYRGKKIIIVNKKYADDAEIIVGDVAIGYM